MLKLNEWFWLVCLLGVVTFPLNTAVSLDAESLPNNVGASGANTLTGQYIVSTTRDMTLDGLRNSMHKCSYQEAKSLGNNQFLIIFNRDPGIGNVRACLASAKVDATVSPNFVYQLQPPLRNHSKTHELKK
jgi:hypothetical protein